MRTEAAAHGRRDGSVYVAVTGAALLVSMIALTAIHIARIELAAATGRRATSEARLLAESSVEHALARINLDPTWRTTFTHGVEVTSSPSGFAHEFSFRLLDNADGDLADDDTEAVEVQGIGRAEGATFVYTVTYEPTVATRDQIGPIVVREYTAQQSLSSGTIDSSNWLGQYFKPILPPEAVSWSVTSVDIVAEQSGAADESLTVGLYTANPSQLPGALLEAVAVNEAMLPSGGPDWHEVRFGGVTGLDPSVALCLTLTGASPTNAAASIEYAGGGVSEADSHLIVGTLGNWQGTEPDKALRYRVRGCYTTESATGEFQVTPGTWRRSAAP